jgi:hypothetical protein
MEPVKIPAPPIPAIARPMTSAIEVGATPEINEPSSKNAKAVRKRVFTGIIE